MPALLFDDVQVQFPFVPYDCQKKFMHKLIQALNAGTNCILESPTGTGKTMSLLCAALGWREDFLRKNNYQAPGDDDWLPHGIDDDSGGFRKPQIVYASRTHGQLAQVVKELKRSAYSPRVVVVGSRQHMCVNPEAQHVNGTARNNYCKELVKSRNCEYHAGIDEHAKKKNATEILDIEDLVNVAKEEKFCPYANVFPCLQVLLCSCKLWLIGEFDIRYYLMQDETVQRTADIIFMPYNYLVSQQSRAALKIDWKNAIIIFDEAHNLDSICCDASSFDITPELLGGCITEVDRIIQYCRSQSGSASSASDVGDDRLGSKGMQTSCLMMKAILLDMEAEIQKFPFSAPTGGLRGQAQSFTASGDEFLNLLQRVKINPGNAAVFIRFIDEEILRVLEEWRPAAAAKPLSFEVLRDAILLVYPQTGQPIGISNSADGSGPGGGGAHQGFKVDFSRFYRVHVHEAEPNSNAVDGAAAGSSAGRGGRRVFSGFQKKAGRTLSMWCMHPGIALAQLKALGVRSIVLTSGTLSPISALVTEFAPLKFPYRLENTHVVSASQVRVLVVERGVTNRALDGSFKSRQTNDYKLEMGNTVAYFCRTVPDGLLVFFSSYTMMGECTSFWQSHNGGSIWNRIEQHKETFVEPRRATEFNDTVEAYNNSLASNAGGGGAVFFAVCRGKASEGIDFSDFRCRAVVAIGIPFPSVAAPKVVTKRSFMDALKTEHKRTTARSGGTTGSIAARQRKEQGDAMLSGSEWYNIQASRAVNQAIGRVIRHIDDWGAIILCDRRFAKQSQRSLLSRWLNPYWHVAKNFADTARTLTAFFKQFPKRAKQSRAPAAGLSAESGIGAQSGASPLGTIEFERPTTTRQIRKTLSSELVRHGDVGDGSGSQRTVDQQRELLTQVWNDSTRGERKTSSFSANWQMQDEIVASPTKAKRAVECGSPGSPVALKSSEACLRHPAVSASISGEVKVSHPSKRTRVEKLSKSFESAELQPEPEAARQSQEFDGSARAQPSSNALTGAANEAAATKVPTPRRRKSVARKKHPSGATLFEDVKAAIGKQGVALFKKQVLKLRKNKTIHDWKVAIDGFAELFAKAGDPGNKTLMKKFSSFVPKEFRMLTEPYS